MTVLLEDLAEYAHNAWSGWMLHVFNKGTENPDGTLTLPKWAVDRWHQQIKTKYKDLSNDEQNSDRAQARKIITIMKGN